MSYEPLPDSVMSPVTTLLDWLEWIVLLLCAARLVWVGGQLAIRLYRDEAIEGLIGSMLAAFLVGAASGIALALYPVS